MQKTIAFWPPLVFTLCPSSPRFQLSALHIFFDVASEAMLITCFADFASIFMGQKVWKIHYFRYSSITFSSFSRRFVPSSFTCKQLQVSRTVFSQLSPIQKWIKYLDQWSWDDFNHRDGGLVADSRAVSSKCSIKIWVTIGDMGDTMPACVCWYSSPLKEK